MEEILVKGVLQVDRWGPFSFYVRGKNSAERQAIADFLRVYHPKKPVGLITTSHFYRALGNVESTSLLLLTDQADREAEVQVCIMPPNRLAESKIFRSASQEKIKVVGTFFCQHCGPLTLTLHGSNTAEQKKISGWIRSYIDPIYHGEDIRLQDMLGQCCLNIYFIDEQHTEADIQINVLPSFWLARSINSQEEWLKAKKEGGLKGIIRIMSTRQAQITLAELTGSPEGPRV